jgi:Carboxypeptidase regulatory-like domain
MSIQHKFEISFSNWQLCCVLLSPKPTQRYERVFGTPPGVVRVLLTIAIALVLCDHPRPLVAQQAAHTEVAGAIVTPVEGDPVLRESGIPDSGTDGPEGAAIAPNMGTITGTVLDVDGSLIPGATVVLTGSGSGNPREVVADDNAAFKFDSVKPGIPYEVSVHVKGFSTWTSPSIVLEPSQFFFVEGIHLKLETEATSITVYGSTEQIAVEQVRLEEQQRVLGFIPNFYVVYDSANAVPLTTKLKFKLAMKVSTDAVSIAGVGLMSSINQAADRPNYVQGAKGYGQRFGAEAALGFSDIFIGGAVLPSLLHQDPRYFYQGTGGTRSRLEHAVASPFICRGDNGHRQINFSSIGGDIGSTALSMTYYPESNRGAGEVLGTFAISTAERVMAAVAQEFIIPRLTPSLKKSR